MSKKKSVRGRKEKDGRKEKKGKGDEVETRSAVCGSTQSWLQGQQGGKGKGEEAEGGRRGIRSDQIRLDGGMKEEEDE